MKTLRHLKAAIAKSPHAEHLSFDVENPPAMSNEGFIDVYLDPKGRMQFEGGQTSSVSVFYTDLKETKSEAIESAIEDIERIAPMEAWLAEEHGIEL